MTRIEVLDKRMARSHFLTRAESWRGGVLREEHEERTLPGGGDPWRTWVILYNSSVGHELA